MIPFLGGLLLCGALLPLALRAAGPRLTVSNYRGVPVKVAGGVAIAGAIALTELARWRLSGPPGREAAGLLVLTLGFFGLGLLDDLLGDGSSRGIGGHLRALLRGRLTTGSVKALGGLALAGAVALWWSRSIPRAVLDGTLIALGANLLNLLDLRPGRATKAFLLLWVPLAIAATDRSYLMFSAAAAGAAALWLAPDLLEKGMLGDAGANLLGAVLGAGVVLNLPLPARGVVLALLAALNLASERWSFSRAIERVPPLRWLDRAGRRPA